MEHIGPDCDLNGTTSRRSTRGASSSTRDDSPTLFPLETYRELAKKNFQVEIGSSREDSHAKIYRRLARRKQDSKENVAVSGINSIVLLAIYDLDSQSWKTAGNFLIGGSPKFADHFPKSGMTRNGKLFELRISGRRMKGKGSGLWPTPLTSDFRNRGCRVGKGQMNLSHFLYALGRRDLQLSPTFREELMGFPTGWTDSADSAIRLSLRSRR